MSSPVAQPEPAPSSPSPADSGPPPLGRRGVIVAVSGLAASLLVAALSILPSPYALGSPGPTFDTLGESAEGEPRLTIEGAPTYDASGELRVTTVSVSKGGDSILTMGAVLRAWVLPDMYVTPQEAVFGTPDQEEEVEEQAQQDWISSEESATVAALEALGQDVPATLVVAGTDSDSHATGLLEAGDVIVSANGEPMDSFTELSAALDPVAPGDDVTIGYERDGVPGEATFATLDDGSGGAIMGIWVDPLFDLPIDVSVNIAEVGGPSAGLMLALSIMDVLTEEDELNGESVAGTGAISADGDVHPIGGIRMKLYGALEAGATSFLAPVENCDEVIGHIPEGLSVYSVDTLDDAYEAITRIGQGDVAELATCAASCLRLTPTPRRSNEGICSDVRRSP